MSTQILISTKGNRLKSNPDALQTPIALALTTKKVGAEIIESRINPRSNSNRGSDRRHVHAPFMALRDALGEGLRQGPAGIARRSRHASLESTPGETVYGVVDGR